MFKVGQFTKCNWFSLKTSLIHFVNLCCSTEYTSLVEVRRLYYCFNFPSLSLGGVLGKSKRSTSNLSVVLRIWMNKLIKIKSSLDEYFLQIKPLAQYSDSHLFALMFIFSLILKHYNDEREEGGKMERGYL